MAEQKYVCPNCSGLIDYGTRFCPHCGNALGNWGNAYSSAPVNNNAAVVKEESFFEKYFSTKGRTYKWRVFDGWGFIWCSNTVPFGLNCLYSNALFKPYY